MTNQLLPPNIVVLVHGNNGAPTDFDAVEAALRCRHSTEELLIIKSASNHTITSHGIEAGGRRLAAEVANTVLAHDFNPLVDGHKLSFVAHSLGGLYCRYALPELMRLLSILRMEYVSLVTLCSPHVGSRRPVSESRLKNLWRFSVHTVLAMSKFYGATGMDLLIELPRQEADKNNNADERESKRPVLEEMTDPESEYMACLKAFRFCTLIAMTDGDVIVPYASASIRNFNPYLSNTITERFAQWRWHIHHTGFATSCSTFVKKLDAHVDGTVQVDNYKAGLDITSSTRFHSEGGYECDNKQEVEFKYDMMLNLQRAVPWRRIDITVEPGCVKGKMRLHDWPINKCQVPDSRSGEFIDLLCDMLASDHQMDVDSTASRSCQRSTTPTNQRCGNHVRLPPRRSYSVPSVFSMDVNLPDAHQERLSDGAISFDERDWMSIDCDASPSNVSTESFFTANTSSPHSTLLHMKSAHHQRHEDASNGKTDTKEDEECCTFSNPVESTERKSEALTDTSSITSPLHRHSFSLET